MSLPRAVVLLGICALALATSLEEYNALRKYKVDDKVLLQRQKDVLHLLLYINQPSYNEKLIQIAKDYSIEANIASYRDPQVVKTFLKYYREGYLPRGEIFSEFYPHKLKQAKALFELLYEAKDYDTFYKTAVWARNNMNEGLFLYSFSVAVIHRPDTYGIILPPIYELYPYYFFNAEVIEKAQQYKQQYYYRHSHENHDHEVYTIYANHSRYHQNKNFEADLSYFTEDVGINAYYYYYNLYYPFWLSGEKYNLKYDRRGEQYYYTYQQLLARYHLERISNGYREIDVLQYDQYLPEGYYPSLKYPSGEYFASRPNYVNLHDYFYSYGQKAFNGNYVHYYTDILDYERRIRDAIDSGYIYNEERGREGERIPLYTEYGIEVLSHIIEGNPDSPNLRYYGALQVLVRNILGYSFDRRGKLPSVLEHFENSLYDPAFYRFYKRIVLFFQHYKNHYPAYTYSELHYPGVKVEKVEVDKLVTYFDYFDADVSSSVYVTPDEYRVAEPEIKARQYRLNHKPFNYKIKVTAERPEEAVVRVYLGPKFHRHEIEENRHNFVEIDEFRHKFVAGVNEIERNSRQSWYSVDKTSIREFYHKVEAAINGTGDLELDATEAYYGFPLRYLLPKGTKGGQTYQVYVIVSPYKKYPHKREEASLNYYFPRVGTGGNYIDGLPFGYPFDRRIENVHEFYSVPNSYFHDVVIYHKTEDEINASI